MGMFNDPARQARARMEQAEQAARREAEPQTDGDGKPRPRRYKLYDRIADKVSVKTMNVVVAVVSILLVAVLIYGIATGDRG